MQYPEYEQLKFGLRFLSPFEFDMYPNNKIVVSANLAAGCAVPDFKENEDGSDWNDYFDIHGEDDTRQKLKQLILEAITTKQFRY